MLEADASDGISRRLPSIAAPPPWIPKTKKSPSYTSFDPSSFEIFDVALKQYPKAWGNNPQVG